MEKFEYLVETFTMQGPTPKKDMTEALNEYGKEGWELVLTYPPVKSIEGGGVLAIFFFKRKIQ